MLLAVGINSVTACLLLGN